MPPVPLRALIIDDEAPARARARTLLERAGGVEIAGEAANAQEAIALIESAQPDVLLLDIQMPGIDGLRLLESLDDPPAVIFSTAHEHYAVRAFDLEAADYLLKPYSAQRLARALDRVRRLLSGGEGRAEIRAGEQADERAHGWADERTEEREKNRKDAAGRKPNSDGDSWRKPPGRAPAGRKPSRAFPRWTDAPPCWVEPRRIVLLRIEEGVVFLIREDGERLICERTLNQLESELPARLFFRASRQAIINIEAIESLTPVEDGGLEAALRGRQRETVSRRRARHLLARIAPESPAKP